MRAVAAIALLLATALPAGAGIPLIRVALRTQASEVRVSSRGAWFVGRDHSGSQATRVLAGEEWTLAADGSAVAVRDGAGRLRATVRDTLYAYPESHEFGPLRLDGMEYRGQLLVWVREGALQAINVIDLESYLKGVLPREMGPQPPERFEALKAQAVAGRSYTLATMRQRRWSDRGFDLKSTAEDQVYTGVEGEKGRCSEAVEATRGVVAVYDRQPIRAFYSSTCGGHTCRPSEVWTNRTDVDYLKGVRDKTSRVDDSFCAGSPRYKWAEVWTGPEFEQMLDQTLPNAVPGWDRRKYGRFRDLEIKGRTESKRVSDLRLEFEHGSVSLGGDAIRWTIRTPKGAALRSCLLVRVGVEWKGGQVRRVKITGHGFGHGVGMCQYGAMGMSEAGYNYADILRFYYRGSRLRRFY